MYEMKIDDASDLQSHFEFLAKYCDKMYVVCRKRFESNGFLFNGLYVLKLTNSDPLDHWIHTFSEVGLTPLYGTVHFTDKGKFVQFRLMT